MEVFCYSVTMTSHKVGYQVLSYQCLLVKQLHYDEKHQEVIIVTFYTHRMERF